LNLRALTLAVALAVPAAALAGPSVPVADGDTPLALARAGTALEDPPYPPYVPPPLPERPNPPVGRQMGQGVGFRPGLLLTAGWQRDLSMGAELQLRLARNLGLGFGAQMGMALGHELVCSTYGGTGRFYAGNRQRFVAEAGFAKNRIDPYLGVGDGPADCSTGEVNYGPEASLGYQAITPGGFVFEALGGMTFILNDAMAREHGSVAPLIQIKVGFLID